MKRVENKTVLVTGAARGIGRACSELLAREGAVVFLSDIDDEPGEEAASAICEAGDEARYVHLDVRSDADWQRAVEQIERERGRIDVLVNNAGLYLIRPIGEADAECFRRIFETNVLGTLLGMKHVAPRMAERGGGSIVNMSSMDAIVGAEGFAIYGGSKGAVMTMTRDAAIEYASKGVRVSSVHPGYIRTRMAEYGAKHEGKSVDELGEDFPLGHIGEPIDVAWGVLYLASDESRWVTGIELRIDGGVTAGG